jgi:ribonuclease R
VIRGRIAVHPRGFGFLDFTRDDGAPMSAFVAPPALNPLLDGDVVDAEVTTEGARSTASALALVQRTREELFGTVVLRGGQRFLKVDRLVANTDWPLEGTDAGEGTALVARVKGRSAVFERLAGPDLALERCIVRHGVRATFSEALLEEAKSATPDLGHRRDLRELPTVTIDAAQTRDIDDALAALPAAADGAIRVLVSIADVDAFVREGSLLDREARQRGTSVYLAGRVIPMLPEVLSSENVSLVQGAVRAAMTVEMRVDPEGAIRAVDIYPSVIRSHARLTYDAVAELLRSGSSTEVPVSVVPTLRWLRAAAARLSTVRAGRGGFELAREEAYVTLDTAGAPLEITPREETEAHRLVERLMVAANECVATWLVERGLPGIYRVHEPPTADKVESLARFAHHFGIEAGFGEALTPRGLAAFDAQLKDSACGPAVRTVLSRVLGPAKYTHLPGAHFGLAAPLYLHFTSPIRRYADLAVHRVIKRYLAGERAFEGGLAAHAELASELDRATYRAARAETERHRMLVARLFADRVGQTLAGNIVSVKPFGLVVQLVGTGVTGTLALENARIDLLTQIAVLGERRYTVGDPLMVTIAGTNEELGRIELSEGLSEGTA